jgi:hypothetical protein
MNFGNQYVSSKQPDPLAKVFDQFGARGIKRAMQTPENPFAKLTTQVSTPEQPEPRATSNDFMSLLSRIFGESLGKRRLLGELGKTKALRNSLAIDSPIKRMLEGM